MQDGFFAPLGRALKSFLFEVETKTAGGPHIRDGVDLKRWMMLVVYAMLPCAIMAVWNTGVQSLVYSEGLHDAYVVASGSFHGYFSFCKPYIGKILELGLRAFLPILIISYGVGGFWEVLFACVRRHEVSEGFLVTGMLYALILPSTIPYWMAGVGISVGVVLGKELFGGTGMNIFNPALVARCFLFFTFPQSMTGEVWVGTNPHEISQKIEQAGDGTTQQSVLNFFNISTDIKRIHVDTIAGKTDQRFETPQELEAYVTRKTREGGLGLPNELYANAAQFAKLRYGEGALTNGNFFWGNMIGSMGETSFFACLLGAAMLLGVGIASWRVMLAMLLGGAITALAFWLFAQSSLWTPAKFDFPFYKHLLIGSFAFGLVFMATEPVTAPKQSRAKWAYGFLIGLVVIVIRVVNPAFPEGVMLAILFGNVFSPLFDSYALKALCKKRRARAEKLLG